MSPNIVPVTRRTLLKWGGVGFGLETIPSQANFFMINLKREMPSVQAALRARNVSVGRPFYPLTNYLRVTLGTRPEMERFIEEFKQVMA